ncbi:urease accessory protein UreF [Ramlibacter alkalitolerans]|uniref:Urease accessory protein UreF n=1 Tax=Ramlibacter alkalitolerans TaxID=2039631 RepID=A0ABS1JQP2_9BURK|nr:urease accessory UreF family protein [Ramlibacter alkalitolerans]MBL0426589.1 urease accessory protein UreF [Ramlibacter alkalitolerans]
MASTESPAPADAALLQLIWLASPALPVGGFSYSEVMEAAVEAALVHDEASAGGWLLEQLHLSLARGDLAVVASAVAAARAGDAPRLQALDDWVRQTRETSELRQQVEQMGRSMGEWQRSLAGPGGRADVGRGERSAVGWGERASEPQRSSEAQRAGVPFGHHQPTKTDYTYPVAFALAASTSSAAIRHIALAFAFAWSENMVQAAVKSVPLGQSAGQRILGRLAAALPQAVEHALALGDNERQAFAPMLAILSSHHETQYSRLFRS